jgi:hypothetical protein
LKREPMAVAISRSDIENHAAAREGGRLLYIGPAREPKICPRSMSA